MANHIKEIAIKNIKVFSGRRSVDKKNVRVIADLMSKIGLNTPITVRKCKTGVRLVAGLHRLKAAKLLGWKKIKAVQMSGNKTQAGLWEDSENLHRAELKVFERSVKINRWRRHFFEGGEGRATCATRRETAQRRRYQCNRQETWLYTRRNKSCKTYRRNRTKRASEVGEVRA